MQDGWTQLLEQPLVLALVVVGLGLLVYALLKRLLKLVAVVLLGLLVVSAGYVYTGREPPEAIRAVLRAVGWTDDSPGGRSSAGPESGLPKRAERPVR